MSDQESHHERALGGQLLASVSRSFYLTLKALPKELREPLSLAYLLARTADTIADTAAVSAEVRLSCLKHYHELIQQPVKQHQHMLSQLIASEFVNNQTDEAERRLMERFEDGLAWLRSMQGSSLAAIQQVLERIIQGQTLDIQRFPNDGALRCLQTAEELDEYTWLVAGCVGEFWTEMCALIKPTSLHTSVSVAQMKSWGARLGKGLQLINILRDVGEDLRDGRCYLPGHETAIVRMNPSILQPTWNQWLATCRDHLECGLQYVQHVADGKLRYATSLPLFLGAKTLTRMQSASWEELQKGIKISRIDVAMILAEAAIACRSQEGIGKMFKRLNQ